MPLRSLGLLKSETLLNCFISYFKTLTTTVRLWDNSDNITQRAIQTQGTLKTAEPIFDLY